LPKVTAVLYMHVKSLCADEPSQLLRVSGFGQVANNKRYAAAAGKGFTVSEVAEHVKSDFGKIDILVHSLANGPEVTKPLLETSRRVSDTS